MATLTEEIAALEARADAIKGGFVLDGKPVTFTVAYDDYNVTAAGAERFEKACALVEAMQAALASMQAPEAVR